jgi:hypothetical protein
MDSITNIEKSIMIGNLGSLWFNIPIRLKRMRMLKRIINTWLSQITRDVILYGPHTTKRDSTLYETKFPTYDRFK